MMSDPSSAAAATAARDEPPPIHVLEAILFTGGAPISIEQLVDLIELDEEQIVQSVAGLNQHYFRQGRPYEIIRTGQSYQMLLRPQFLNLVRRLSGRSREVRLSVAAIEVLALVAYRQPVSLKAIDAVRGVDSGPIVRQLRRRNLIELAEPDEQDRSERFRTTKRFLQIFQLSSLDDLPRVQELEKA